MTEIEIFYKIADSNFHIFSICSESDVQFFRSIYKDKSELHENIKQMLFAQDGRLKWIIRVEIFCLLIQYVFDKCLDITNLEVCAVLLIFYELLTSSFRKNLKSEILNKFKNLVIKHSMNRPPYQIGILTKATVEKVTDFFIDNIHSRFEFLKYMLTKKKNIEIVNKDLFEIKLPHILDLEMGHVIVARHTKILKQYLENRNPKTEIEQKIEMIIEFERERLDKKVEDTFINQDQEFNKKLDDLLSKKKK